MKMEMRVGIKKLLKTVVSGMMIMTIPITYATTDLTLKKETLKMENGQQKQLFETPVFGTPQAAGTACPGGVINYQYMAEDGELILSLDGYVAEAGGLTGKRMDRKTCQIAIPISMPQMVSVGLSVKPLNGWADLPFAGSAKARAEAFFVGGESVVVEKDFTNFDGLDDENSEDNPTVWSECGVNSNIRLNTSLLVKTNSLMESAFAIFGPNIDLQIKFRSCR